jgi:hypothetical protein
MRQSRILVATLSALFVLAPGAAFAFDVQSMGGANSDGSPMLMDPDGASSKSSTSEAPNGAYLNNLQLQLKANGQATPSFTGNADNGWMHLAPGGRMTR